MPSSPAVFGSGQLAYKSEVNWASAVTPDRFIGFLSEGLKPQQQYIKDESIRGGRRTLAFQKRGTKTVGGPINTNFPNVDIAPLLKHCFGSVSTTGSGPTWTHTYAPGVLFGKSMTWQKGMPDRNGTVVPWTFNGCKVDNFELSAAISELVKFNFELTAKDWTKATGLVVASYDTDYLPFSFVEAVVEIPDGTEYDVTGFSFTGQNSLKKDRFKLGSRVVREQYDNGRMAYAIGFNVDFVQADYDRIENGDLLKVSIVLSNVDDGGSDTFTVTANGRFIGDAPAMGGPDAVTWDYSFEIESEVSDADALTAVLVNTDSSAA